MKKMASKDLKTLEAIIEPKTNEIEISEGDSYCKIQFNDYLSFMDITKIIDSIVDTAISYDMYSPLNLDLSLATHIIRELTNIPLPTTADGLVDVEKCYDIYTRLHLRERLCEASSNVRGIIYTIENCAQKQIEYELQQRYHNSKSGESVGSFLKRVIELGATDKTIQNGAGNILDYLFSIIEDNISNKGETQNGSNQTNNK